MDKKIQSKKIPGCVKRFSGEFSGAGAGAPGAGGGRDFFSIRSAARSAARRVVNFTMKISFMFSIFKSLEFRDSLSET